MNEYYAVVRLVTGEQVMAVLTAEDEEYVELLHPMIIRIAPVQTALGKISDRIFASPFCHFTDEQYFRIKKDNLLFIKPLHQEFISHYKRLISEIEEPVLVKRQADGTVKQELNWDDEEEEQTLTIDEINRRLEMLQSIIDAPKKEQEEQEEEYKFFVDGNNTIN